MAVVDAYRLNSSMKCAKVMLLIISFMFALTAILLIMVGTTIQTIFGDFRQFIDDHFLSPPALIITTGFLMIAIAIMGAWGAYKESCLVINLYGVSLLLVFILELSAAVAAVFLQGDVRNMLIRTMNESFYQYEENFYLKNGVDFMQRGLECCGIFSPADWKPILSENKSNNETLDIYVPPSCCHEFNSQTLECQLEYEVGCLNRMDFIISQSAMLIVTGASTVAFVQLLGAICAFMLAKTLRRNKSIREARRWQLQQSLGVLIAGTKDTSQSQPMTTGYQQLEKHEKDLEEYTANSPSVN